MHLPGCELSVRTSHCTAGVYSTTTYERQRGGEVVDVGFLGDVDHLVHGRRPRVVSVGDVVVDGRVKEDRLLRDESQLRAHPLDIE